MAEEQKPVDVVAPAAVEETIPAVAPEETPAAAIETVAPVTDDKPAEEAKPAKEKAEETEAPKEEDKKEEAKEEVKPIDAGFLGHKAQGASFPKNLIASKAFFFFGSDSVEPETLSAYKRGEKSTETAHHNIAWAAHTGKGLLFIGDKKFPHGIINLSDATEPETDGSNKFFFSAKGNKHSFKAATAAERDNWVAQLKEKIAEAKEFAATVTESELYKKTVESFKPAPKEEKVVEAPKEETAPVEEADKTEEAAPKEEEAPKEAPKEEAKPAEEPKRRSASRKRASFFGFGKKEEKKEETTPEEVPAVETPAVVEPVAETEAPAAEETPAPETAAPEVAPETPPKDDVQPESPKEKPATSKRNSFFGGVFSKKEKKAAEPKADAEVPQEETAATESAPVIPPVETSDPLAVDVSSPAAAPAEVVEPAEPNGEPKKDVKEKRKSSLPFAFGKRDKSPAPASDGEEKASKSPFSKLRATIKGKTSKTEEKPTEEAKAETEAVKEESAVTEEAPKAEEEAPKAEEAPKEEVEAENKPESAAASTPAVTAAA